MSNITFYQIAQELGYVFDSLRRVYNRARDEEAEAKDLPTIGVNDIVPAEAEAFIRSRFKGKGDKPKTVLEMPQAATVNSENEKLRKQLDSKQSALDSLNLDFNKKQKSLEATEMELATALRQLDTYKANLQQTSTDLTIVNAQSKSVALQIESYKKEAEKAKTNEATANNKLNAATEKMGDLKAELATVSSKLFTAEKDLKTATEVHDSKMKSSSALGTISENQTKQLLQFSATIDDLEKSNNQYKKDLLAALELIKTLEASIDELTAKLQKVAWKFYIPTRLDLINYTEMGLASYGLWVMLGVSGLLLSIISNVFYYDAQKTLKNDKAWESASFALFITFALAVGFGFVHFNTFMKTDTVIQYDKWWTSVLIAITISGLSFASLWQSNNKTNEL